MALVATAFKTLIGGTAGQLHYYQSPDAPATIAASGYFNDLTLRLKQSDIILVAGTIGGIVTVDMLVVTSATAAATVTTTNGT